MRDDLLTQMERSGSIVTFSCPTDAERAKIIMQYSALRAQGHALSVDDSFRPSDANDKPEIRVFHYKTCTHVNCNAKGAF